MRRLSLVLLLAVLTVLGAGCKAKGGAPPPSAIAPAPTPPGPDSATAAATVPPASDGQAAPGQTLAAAPTTATAPSASAGGSTDWPRYQGPTGNSLAPKQNLNTNWNSQPPRKLWEAPMSDGGYSGPAVAGGRVYIVDHQGQEDIVRCLDLSSGKEAWSYRYSEGGGENHGFTRATPCIAGGKVYTIDLQRLHDRAHPD